MVQIKKGKDLMEDVRIVEDGVTNAQTAGATIRKRKDRKITALQKQKETKTQHSSQTIQVKVKQPSFAQKYIKTCG